MFTIACSLVVGLGLALGLGLDLVFGCLVVMHTYLCDNRLQLLTNMVDQESCDK